MKTRYRTQSEKLEEVNTSHTETKRAAHALASNLVPTRSSPLDVNRCEQSITAQYDGLLKKVTENLGANRVERAALVKNRALLEKERNESNESIRILEVDRGRLFPSFSRFKYFAVLLAGAIFFAGDGLINATSFQIFESEAFVTWFFSGSFALALACLSFLVPRRIARIQDSRARKWTAVQFIFAVTVLFVFVALIRVQAVKGTIEFTPLTIVEVSAFTLINLAIFLAACLVAVRAAPSEEQWHAKKQLGSVQSRLKSEGKKNAGREKRLQALELQIKELDQEYENAKADNEYFTRYIHALRDEVIAAFRNDYEIKKRRDVPALNNNHRTTTKKQTA